MLFEFENPRKEELIDKLSEDLLILRTKTSMSQEEIANAIGISRQTYSAIEAGKKRMTWRTYLALIMMFDYNPKTHEMIRQINIFPSELEEARLVKDNDEKLSTSHAQEEDLI